MSKSISARAKPVDWVDLERRVEADNFADVRWLELWEQDGNERRRVGWEPLYVHALQKSIEGRQHDPLLALLDKSAPIHPLLLPLVGEALRMVVQGLTRGKPKAMTDLEERAVASFLRLTGAERGEKGKAMQQMADLKKVDVSTIKRAEKKQKPRK